MTDRTNKADEILDVAERMARTGGYNGFSYREIAKAIGIKAASVHYHFPGKEDLGAAVAKRYTERFLTSLGDAGDAAVQPKDLLRRYVGAYRQSLVEEKLMCLCGMFGAEIAYLPGPIVDEARRFFQENIHWLETVFRRAFPDQPTDRHRAAAMGVISTLEGAMIMARTLDDTSVFDQATEGISLSL